VDADKFDNLAKVAMRRQMTAESTGKAHEPNLAAQSQVVDQLKHGLDQMKGKLGELTAKRNGLAARSRVVAAQSQVNDALKSLNVADAASALGRYEERIRREEATARGQQELAASSLDAQFASLEDLGEQTEVEARLAALRAGGTQKAIDY
jgi:phage shock protein A